MPRLHINTKPRMIDLHCHLLPGFDDGAVDWLTAVKMCRMAAQDGITCIVATPHFHRGLFPTPSLEALEDSVQELRDLCKKGLIDELELLIGSDCHLHAELVENLREGSIPTINGGRYLLLEPPSNNLPPRMDHLFFDILLAGVTPIITHPERNQVFMRQPDLLLRLVEGGAYAQVTAASLVGSFGSSVRSAAEEMVGLGLVQMIATDAHDPEKRPPLLSEARQIAATIVGEDLANRMVEDVPRAVVEDRPIDYPEPVVEQSKRPWWKRLAGR
jgi:protein-tyrosine phosphatase